MLENRKIFFVVSWFLILSVFIAAGAMILLKDHFRIGSDYIIKEAKITGVDVHRLESYPIQILLIVKGEVGDACSTLGETVVTREGSTFNIEITTVRPKNALCAQILNVFERKIPLDVYEIEAGSYIIDVNGFQEKLVFETDNVPVITPLTREVP